MKEIRFCLSKIDTAFPQTYQHTPRVNFLKRKIFKKRAFREFFHRPTLFRMRNRDISFVENGYRPQRVFITIDQLIEDTQRRNQILIMKCFQIFRSFRDNIPN